MIGVVGMKWFGIGRRQKNTKIQNQNVGLFNALNPRELRIVAGFMNPRQFLAGEVVFDAGEEGQALYIVEHGQVGIYLPDESVKPLALLEKGEYFGELGLLDGWPRSAQARAIQAAELSVMSRGDFEKLMESHAAIASKIALELARHLGRRLRQMLDKSETGGAVQ